MQIPEIKTRIAKILSSGDLAFLLNPNRVESPIERFGDWVLVHGCEPHNCGDHHFAIAINYNTLEPIVCIAKGGTLRWFRNGHPPQTKTYPFGAGCSSTEADPMPAMLGSFGVYPNGHPVEEPQQSDWYVITGANNTDLCVQAFLGGPAEDIQKLQRYGIPFRTLDTTDPTSGRVIQTTIQYQTDSGPRVNTYFRGIARCQAALANGQDDLRRYR